MPHNRLDGIGAGDLFAHFHAETSDRYTINAADHCKLDFAQQQRAHNLLFLLGAAPAYRHSAYLPKHTFLFQQYRYARQHYGQIARLAQPMACGCYCSHIAITLYVQCLLIETKAASLLAKYRKSP